MVVPHYGSKSASLGGIAGSFSTLEMASQMLDWGRKRSTNDRQDECLLAGARAAAADVGFGSFGDMRAARERTFSGAAGRHRVQTPSTNALNSGFGRPGVAKDWSVLKADISAAHRAEPVQPLKIPQRTLPWPGGRTATAALQTPAGLKGCQLVRWHVALLLRGGAENETHPAGDQSAKHFAAVDQVGSGSHEHRASQHQEGADHEKSGDVHRG